MKTQEVKAVSKNAFHSMYPDAYSDGCFSTLPLTPEVRRWDAPRPMSGLTLTEETDMAKKVEAKLGRSIKNIRLAELIKEDPRGESKAKDFGLDFLKLTQGGLDSLIKTKVEQLVMDGATFSNSWLGMAKIHDMADTEKQDIPVTSMDDFAVYKGYVQGTAKLDSGGNTAKISLDVSTEDKIRFMEIPIKDIHVKFKKWNFIEDTLKKAGMAMGLNTLIDIIVNTINPATVNTVFDTTLYKTIIETRRDARLAGFPSNTLIVAPEEEATLLNDTNFIDANRLDRTGQVVRTGQIGKIFDLDVFNPVWGTIATDLVSRFIMFDSERGAHMGMAQDLTIANWDEPLYGLSHAILTMHYDLVAGPTGVNRRGATV